MRPAGRQTQARADSDTGRVPRWQTVSLLLADLVMDLARGVEAVDSRAPVASSARTGASYQPGIGPHTEAQTIKLVMAHLAKADPPRYSSYGLGVPYADGTRQACDVVLTRSQLTPGDASDTQPARHAPVAGNAVRLRCPAAFVLPRVPVPACLPVRFRSVSVACVGCERRTASAVLVMRPEVLGQRVPSSAIPRDALRRHEPP